MGLSAYLQRRRFAKVVHLVVGEMRPEIRKLSAELRSTDLRTFLAGVGPLGYLIGFVRGVARVHRVDNVLSSTWAILIELLGTDDADYLNQRFHDICETGGTQHEHLAGSSEIGETDGRWFAQGEIQYFGPKLHEWWQLEQMAAAAQAKHKIKP